MWERTACSDNIQLNLTRYPSAQIWIQREDTDLFTTLEEYDEVECSVPLPKLSPGGDGLAHHVELHTYEGRLLLLQALHRFCHLDSAGHSAHTSTGHGHQGDGPWVQAMLELIFLYDLHLAVLAYLRDHPANDGSVPYEADRVRARHEDNLSLKRVAGLSDIGESARALYGNNLFVGIYSRLEWHTSPNGNSQEVLAQYLREECMVDQSSSSPISLLRSFLGDVLQFLKDEVSPHSFARHCLLAIILTGPCWSGTSFRKRSEKPWHTINTATCPREFRVTDTTTEVSVTKNLTVKAYTVTAAPCRLRRAYLSRQSL